MDASVSAIQSDINARHDFLDIDAATLQTLKDARPIIEPHMERILDSFYGHINRFPDLAAKFSSSDSRRRARDMQKSHWMNFLFAGDLGEDYFEKARRVGRVHERIGLEPQWYMGGYRLIMTELAAVLLDALGEDRAAYVAAMGAVHKALFLDMDIAVSVYFLVAIVKKRLELPAGQHAREILHRQCSHLLHRTSPRPGLFTNARPWARKSAGILRAATLPAGSTA